MPERTIVAMGGLPEEPANTNLEAYLLSCTESRAPRVCLIPTASGDRPELIEATLARFRQASCTPAVLHLFDRNVPDIHAFLTQQDLIMVTGGNTASMSAVWAAHGVDQALRAAYQAGVVLAGSGSGALAWFTAGVSDAFATGPQVAKAGIGLLSGSFCPHYQSQTPARVAFEQAVQQGALPAGFAADDGAWLRFTGGELAEVVASQEEAHAYRVSAGQSRVCVERLPARVLASSPSKPSNQSPQRADRDEPERIVAYTDGACSGNPGPGGWAWAVAGGAFDSGAEPHTTNQRMEVTAAYQAVLAHKGPVEVVSDSTYVVNCFKQRWWEGWLKRGWINSQRRPVANRDLWEPFIKLVRERGNVTFRWVKGHSEDRMNQLVDQLAVEASQAQRARSGRCPKKP